MENLQLECIQPKELDDINAIIMGEVYEVIEQNRMNITIECVKGLNEGIQFDFTMIQISKHFKIL